MCQSEWQRKTTSVFSKKWLFLFVMSKFLMWQAQGKYIFKVAISADINKTERFHILLVSFLLLRWRFFFHFISSPSLFLHHSVSLSMCLSSFSFGRRFFSPGIFFSISVNTHNGKWKCIDVIKVYLKINSLIIVAYMLVWFACVIASNTGGFIALCFLF